MERISLVVCYRLTSFDKSGVINVTSIGKKPFDSCVNLDKEGKKIFKHLVKKIGLDLELFKRQRMHQLILILRYARGNYIMRTQIYTFLLSTLLCMNGPSIWDLAS